MRLFGTNGIREVVGERLTPPFVTAVAGGIGHVCPVGPPIVVGWDGRTSSPGFERIVSGTLAIAGHQVVEVGLLPTPAIQYSVRELGAQFGVILTASHNPPEFNGIKCIAADGLEAPRDVEEAIEEFVARGASVAVPYDRVGDIRFDPHGAHRYVEGIVRCVNAESIRRRKFTLVLDCGNGASAVTSPTLLRRLGCRVITLNGHVDGLFPGHLSEPTEANLVDLAKAVPASGADLGVAHDGDADRAVFVDSAGKFVPGEKTLTLLARDAVRSHGGGVVVTPVSTSQGLEEAIRPVGGEVVYTRVGSPVVSREMQARSAIFGGEENGGLIFPAFQLARDGAMTVAALLDLLARNQSDLTQEIVGLPEFTLVKSKIACPIERRDEVMHQLSEELAKGAERVVTLDGVKVYRDGGWVLVRPSGTEPLIRVFAEARDPTTAARLSDHVVRRVSELAQRVTSAETNA